MQITAFTINEDKTELDLTITDAATVQSLRLWNDSTYKNFTKAIDLSAKLTASATENITITLADIDEEYFDGIYFIEAEDLDEVSIEFAWDLTRFEECVVDRATYVAACDECLLETDSDFIILTGLLDGLEKALNNRLIDQMLFLVNTLNKYCTSDCATCGKYSNVVDNTSEDILGGATITIKIDGGTAEG